MIREYNSMCHADNKKRAEHQKSTPINKSAAEHQIYGADQQDDESHIVANKQTGKLLSIVMALTKWNHEVA